MADLAATDVTVSLIHQDRDFSPQGRVRNFPSITFGDGSSTYGSTNGIPLPDKKVFGMKKEIKRVSIEPNGDGYMYVFDYSDQESLKLKILQCAGAGAPMTEVSSSFAPAATVLALTVDGQ